MSHQETRTVIDAREGTVASVGGIAALTEVTSAALAVNGFARGALAALWPAYAH
jgi:hypothetical protein